MLKTIDHLIGSPFILLETLAGSHAYGLATEHSDEDLRGIFYLPMPQLLGLHYVPQIADSKNDTVFYELGRFVELLTKNNPTILELLFTPADCVRFRHPILDQIRPEMVLSKMCRDSFVGYAHAQIQKARGLNKKVLNPMEADRKGPIAFCYVLEGNQTVALEAWLKGKNWQQEQCGLVALDHAKDTFALFHDDSKEQSLGFKGIFQSEDSNSVSLSSVPKGMQSAAHIVFNKDGYTVYCKDYREYWDWVKKRNESRYENTVGHGKNYDAKNMMHTFRLLAMAEEIAKEHTIQVRRPDRDFLLDIRAGKFDYAELLDQAEERVSKLDQLFLESTLPEKPDVEGLEQALVEMRQKLYNC